MSNEVIAWLESELAKFRPEIKIAENDAKAIGSSAVNYIKANGLSDLYQIATTVLTSIAAATPWTTVLSTVVSQGEAAGIAIAKGAEVVVVGQAQADLIAAGTLLPPVPTPAA